MKNSNYFANIDADQAKIEFLKGDITGTVELDNKSLEAVMYGSVQGYRIAINEILDLDVNDLICKFTTTDDEFAINISVTSNKNNFREGWLSRYSEATVFWFKSTSFIHNLPNYCRSYFHLENSHMLYEFFGAIGYIELTVLNNKIAVKQDENYLIIESVDLIQHDLFSVVCYNVMVAIGFISGKFVQDEVFTFQYKDQSKTDLLGYKYRHLRPSSFSIYHAITGNPFSYKNFIDESYLEVLYNKKTLKHFGAADLSRLTELIHTNKQIQYALVLFNEANGNGMSLLIKNNCFYAVLEVLKKFFCEIFKDRLPKGYSSLGNVLKYREVFKNLFDLTEDECATLEKRNIYLHGDIKDIDGTEMVEVMQKQITLIYRIITTYVGYKGFIIDHYAVRKNQADNAFVEINKGQTKAINC